MTSVLACVHIQTTKVVVGLHKRRQTHMCTQENTAEVAWMITFPFAIKM